MMRRKRIAASFPLATFLSFLLATFFLLPPIHAAIDSWVSMGMQGLSVLRNPQVHMLSANVKCAHFKGLSKGQNKLCFLYEDHMQHVGTGAYLAIQECQWQFRNDKWNCSTFDETSVFGPVLDTASKESAFAHAITAAGVVHVVARACRDGQLTSCGCSTEARPDNLNKEWIWGGCGDNIAYGYRFTEGFVDVKEREQSYSRTSPEHGRKLMNIHNNEAGRRAVIRKMRVTCKCHGVSGSCSLITCWKQLSPFRDVGDYLRLKYDAATPVKLNKRGKLQARKRRFKPTAEDLVYLTDSPDYCTTNITAGSLGTKGRICNKTSTGPDGCGTLCCGRGFSYRRLKLKERCKCKFHWCCYVECKTCAKTVEVHTCK